MITTNGPTTEKGTPVTDVARRLGMSAHSLYAWIERYAKPQEHRQQDDDLQAELRQLRAELKRGCAATWRSTHW